VFDVGANVGDWSRFALSVNPNLQLHCFEPVASTFKTLSANSFPANVTLNHAGLGSEPGSVEMNCFTDPTLNTLYTRDLSQAAGGQALPKETIRLDSFDHYCQAKGIAKVDFVKIDVEGHEISVFKGMKESLAAKRIGTIQFEYGETFRDAGTTLREVFELFLPLGAVFYKIYPRELQRHDVFYPKLEVYGLQNWLIVLDGNLPPTKLQ